MIEQSPFASLCTIKLKAASADETLHVTVSVSSVPEAKNKGQVPVGPFLVRGAIEQPGSIFVTSTGIEPRLHPHGNNITLREPTPDERAAHPAPFLRVYSYREPPQPAKPTLAYGPGSYSLLDLEPEALRGQVRTQTTNTLELKKADTGRRQWTLSTRVKAQLVNQGTVERVEIRVPKDCVFVPSANRPPAPVKEVKAEDGKVTLELAPGETWTEFTAVLEFQFAAEVGGRGETLFELPHVLDTAAGSRTEVRVKAPRDVELTAPEQPGATALTAVSAHALEWKPEGGSADGERPPAAVAVAWRPYQPEVRAVADVTLTTPEGQAQVRHELKYRFPPSPAGFAKGEVREAMTVTLRLPPGVLADTFKVLSGGLCSTPTTGRCGKSSSTRSPGRRRCCAWSIRSCCRPRTTRGTRRSRCPWWSRSR